MEKHTGFAKGLFIGLLAGAAGGILLYSKRDAVTGAVWKLRARAQIYHRIGALKKITKGSYEEIIDDVLDRYRSMKTIASSDIDALAEELRGAYEDVKRRVEEAADDAE